MGQIAGSAALIQMARITFNNKQSPFFRAIKEKVDHYFLHNQLHPAGNNQALFKGVLQLSSALALYLILVFFTPNWFISLFLCGLLGFNLAIIGFNIMHEGGHQSFSKHRWLNKVSAHFLNVLGGNAFFWKIKHNINHHTYTNLEGADADLDVKPLLRLHENQPRYWFHRFQHWYCLFLYGVSYLAWVFYNDFVRYFGVIAPGAELIKLTKQAHFIFWFTKVAYLAAYVALPVLVVGLVPALIGYLVVMVVCGLCISVVFQLAHMVEDTQFPIVDENSNKIQQEWAIHQVNTTANFATKNKLVSWFLGGLNFQVEHHLFPKVSHVHYPQINVLVKETCAEFNVTYVEYASVLKAFQSHLLHIKKLGNS